METLLASGPWAWLVLGLALVGLEVLAPGVFLIWLGIAALLTGLVDMGFGLPWQGALILFAALSAASVLAGRRLTRARGASPDLNRRGENLVGRLFTLDGPVAGGEGRVRVGDSVWRVIGPDLPAGASVRVTRLDGATLVVEPA